MPGGMDGLEVAREAQCRHPDVRVLLTSGYTEHALLHHGQLDEEMHMLGKPYSKDDLALTVRQMLDGKLQ